MTYVPSTRATARRPVLTEVIRNMRNTKMLAFIAVLGVGTGLGFGLKSVLADGIPTPNPLYYSGTLTEGGTLVSGMRTIGVNLYADMMTTTPLCQTVASNTNVANGRFRIALATGCKAAINANPNAYVEVVDGTTSLGREPIGAVPYAVEADHAVNADNATNATNATTALNAAPDGGIATAISSIQSSLNSQASSGYIHIGDTQIAWGYATVNIVNGDGNSEYITVSTPVPFLSAGFAVVATGGEAGICAGNTLGRATGTSSIVLQYAGASTCPSATKHLNWLAIGPWR
jgi:hypothetical protein